jgi:hypothetical protein
MNNTTTRRRAPRLASLSVAGLAVGLALAPGGALASQSVSDGGSSTSTSASAPWSDLYDAAQRREAMARVQEANGWPDAIDAGDAGTPYVNAWSYLYETGPDQTEATGDRVPIAKSRRDSVPQRKAHPALARIVVSVDRTEPSTCYIPDTVDSSTRRLIAVQLCDDAHIVPATFVARAAYDESPAYSLGHL